MPEIRKGHDTDTTYACSLAQHHFSVAQMLQGINLQHHIKRLVAKQSQTLIEIELQHIDATLHASLHICIGQFNTVTRTTAVFLQMVQ